MEPGSHRWRPRLHRDKLPVWLVHRLGGLLEVPQVQEHLADELVPRADHEPHHVVAQGVPVLVQEALHVVPDLAGVVLDAELHRGHPGPRVELVERVVVVALLQEGQVCGLGEVGLVVQEVEDADGLLGHDVEDGLVVGVGDGRPLDLFLGVLGLLQLKDALVEVVLQALVGEVDAELLKAVLGEVLEAEDVKDGDDVALLPAA